MGVEVGDERGKGKKKNPGRIDVENKGDKSDKSYIDNNYIYLLYLYNNLL